MIKKYKKKPVVIEAIQWTEHNKDEIDEFVGRELDYGPVADCDIVIPTLEGDMVANIFDFIIKGIKGEFYPCKPDIFEQTYEEVKQ